MTLVPSHRRPLNGNEMICIPAEIPMDLCAIDDERKAIYHSNNSVCIWVFVSVEDRNRFMKETAGMNKADREDIYLAHFNTELPS
jgi:hypothetical protein